MQQEHRIENLETEASFTDHFGSVVKRKVM
jgi:hypothetical protein